MNKTSGTPNSMRNLAQLWVDLYGPNGDEIPVHEYNHCFVPFVITAARWDSKQRTDFWYAMADLQLTESSALRPMLGLQMTPQTMATEHHRIRQIESVLRSTSDLGPDYGESWLDYVGPCIASLSLDEQESFWSELSRLDCLAEGDG